MFLFCWGFANAWDHPCITSHGYVLFRKFYKHIVSWKRADTCKDFLRSKAQELNKKNTAVHTFSL